MHHGNKSAWPVYLTIGNLNQHIQHQQISPANILVSFIPIIKENDNNIKSKVYYKAMRTILKRMFYFNILILYFIN